MKHYINTPDDEIIKEFESQKSLLLSFEDKNITLEYEEHYSDISFIPEVSYCQIKLELSIPKKDLIDLLVKELDVTTNKKGHILNGNIIKVQGLGTVNILSSNKIPFATEENIILTIKELDNV